MVLTRATSIGNHRSLVRACDSLCGTFCSCDFPESQRKLGPFALLVRNTQFGVYPFLCKVYMHCIYCVYGHSGVDRNNKFFTFCTLCLRVMFTFHKYPNTISYQVEAGWMTRARKEHNFNSCNFYLQILHFLLQII